MEITRVFEFLDHNIKNYPSEVVMATKENGVWEKTSSQELINQSNQFSRGLLKLGIKPGDKIAIVTPNNRSNWHVADFGIQQVGGVTVPMYPTISSDDFAFILNDSNTKFCIAADEELYNKITEAKKECPNLVGIYTFDEVENAPNWKEIMSLGEDDSTQYEVEAVKSLIKPDDLLTIIYTSGTTGRPKGVMLTHKNLASNIIESNKRMPDWDELNISNPKALSFLPINHIYERTVIYGYLYRGISVYFGESIEQIGENIQEVKPHIMTAVPRLIEKVFAKIYDKGTSAGGLKKKIFLWAFNLIEDLEPYGERGFIQKIKLSIADKLVFSKWRDGVGGNLIAMLSGSAALNSRLIRIFYGAGIPILEGYGMTETSPVISVSSLDKDGFKVGWVGKVLENVDLKIAEDGEIQVKGPNITTGYYNNPEKTEELFTEDGYLKTGDIGKVDNDGFLKITDRKKSMFKTSGGKYIAPQFIENEMKSITFIEQILVVGEGEKMPCALIQPDFEFVEKWAKSNNIEMKDPSDICSNQDLKDSIAAEIEIINQKFGKWERIKKFELTPEVWGIDNGLLTPTLKPKRKPIKEYFKDLYDNMYEKEF